MPEKGWGQEVFNSILLNSINCFENQSEQSTKFLGMNIRMDRKVPSYNFNKTQDFLLFYRMYFVVKCPSKNVCPPAPFNVSRIPGNSKLFLQQTQLHAFLGWTNSNLF